MDYSTWVRQERLPTTWCPGCGTGVVMKAACEEFVELEYGLDEVVVVSGIGCSGRTAGYFSIDSVHGAHGRALPVAEGIKRSNPKLKVVVISGDGDLLSIGGNHLIHGARRNTDITVICIDNEIYGMTGGQKGPTTPVDRMTISSPYGNYDRPINAQGLIRAHKNYYGRTTVFHYKHMRKVIRGALEYKGFSFVDVAAQCIENNGRRIGYKEGYDMMKKFKEEFKINKKEDIEYLEKNELGIVK